MKQVMGTLILSLMTASAWAQNPATVLQNTKARAQSVQGQTQTHTHTSAAPVKAKDSVKPAAKPVAQKPVVQKPVAQKAAPAKPVAVSVKPAPVAQKAKPAPAVQAKSAPAQKSQVALKPVAMKPALIAIKPVTSKAPAKVVQVAKAKAPVTAKAVPVAKAKEPVSTKPVATKPVAMAKVDVKDTNAKPEGSEKEKKEDETSTKLISGVGKRDPFVSPVVAQSMSGSGCSVGKKCLAIDQITIRGVVKSDSGMIAVVVNALDKAYFLRENDPVFNGYVEKITEDSIIFKEMYQDKLGKSFARDVTKRIQAPVV